MINHFFHVRGAQRLTQNFFFDISNLSEQLIFHTEVCEVMELVFI